MSKVSGNPTDLGMGRIFYDGILVGCSCGWRYRHRREKVREDSIDRHLGKRHAGRGIRM